MKQDQFLDVQPVQEARRRWYGAIDLDPILTVPVPLTEAHGRVLDEDVIAPGDVPAFDRSNVDGFAVHAADTYGASERTPVSLEVVGTPIDAGDAPEGEVAQGTARIIATGGVVPRGADAIVMVEDTEPAGTAVLVFQPVSPGARISGAGSDLARGETVLRRGTRLTARETGTLAACGIATVHCVGRLQVAIISTGNEIVPPGQALEPGQVHDANATLLADAVRELGGVPEVLGIAPDREEPLRELLERARRDFHVTLVSGGTSKGGGDLSYRVLEEMAPPVVHGVALKPGKPLCLSAWERKPVVLLPGFPTSAIFTFHAMVAPVLRRLLGRGEEDRTTRSARLPRHVRSERGRREFSLVNLVRGRDGLLAFPVGRGSGSVTTFARADGFFEIPARVEYVEAGEEVTVTLLGRHLNPADLVIVGSHCVGLDLIVARLDPSIRGVKVLAVGSRGGVEAVAQEACDVAPVHLYDAKSGAWNEPFAPEGARLVRGYERRQGLAYRKEHAALFEGDDVETAVQNAARDPSLRIANRNPASGTRILVDELLSGGQEDGKPLKPAGWTTSYTSHTAVAAAIAQGRSDYGICLQQSAHAAGLEWRPWRGEHYDFLVPAERWDEAGVRAFRAALESDDVRAALREAGFGA